MVTFAVARGGPAEPTAGSSFHPAFDKATPFPDKGLTIDGRVAPAVTILARYAGWGYRKPRFYGIIDSEANRFSPCGHPHRAFPVTRRWVPWHPIPPCSPKKGDTRASSRDPQSILGLPSASFLLLTRHFMERKPFLLNRDRSRAPCDLIRRTVDLTRNWRCSRSKSDPVYKDLLQILSHCSTRRLQFVRHRELMIKGICTSNSNSPLYSPTPIR